MPGKGREATRPELARLLLDIWSAELALVETIHALAAIGLLALIARVTPFSGPRPHLGKVLRPLREGCVAGLIETGVGWRSSNHVEWVELLVILVPRFFSAARAIESHLARYDRTPVSDGPRRCCPVKTSPDRVQQSLFFVRAPGFARHWDVLLMGPHCVSLCDTASRFLQSPQPRVPNIFACVYTSSFERAKTPDFGSLAPVQFSFFAVPPRSLHHRLDGRLRSPRSAAQCY